MMTGKNLFKASLVSRVLYLF